MDETLRTRALALCEAVDQVVRVDPVLFGTVRRAVRRLARHHSGILPPALGEAWDDVLGEMEIAGEIHASIPVELQQALDALQVAVRAEYALGTATVITSVPPASSMTPPLRIHRPAVDDDGPAVIPFPQKPGPDESGTQVPA